MQATVSAGSVLGRSLSVWGRNFVPFSAVALVAHIPNFVLIAFTEAPRPGERFRPLEAGNGFLSFVLSLAVTGAVTFGVFEEFRNRRVQTGQILRFGFRSMWQVFVTSFAVGLVTAVAMVCLVVPAIVASCGLWVAVPATVAEPGSDRLGRSWELTRGHRFAIFAMLVVLLLFGLAVGGGFALLAATRGLQALPYAASTLLFSLVNVLVSTFGSVVQAVSYHDLRVVKEGADPAQLAAVFE
jgi:hypothetical protein